MPFQIIRQDITKMRCDAIVNAAKHSLLGGGGVDGAIHRAAGPQLLEECRTLGGCGTGEAKLTKGYALPAKYVIHTVGPVWQGGDRGEAELLAACYRNSLELARGHGLKSIAFPLIATGVFGYPKDRALRIATNEITGFLSGLEEDMDVYLCVYGRESLAAGNKLFFNIREYIDDRYVGTASNCRPSQLRWKDRQEAMRARDSEERGGDHDVPLSVCPSAADSAPAHGGMPPLRDYLGELDESFSEMVERKLKESGMTAPECYKRANLDRKAFSKIRTAKHYRPNKQTAAAIAVALRLPFEEARELIGKGGYSLTHSSRFDLILEYCIRKGIYNVFDINEILFEYDQPLLGSRME